MSECTYGVSLMMITAEQHLTIPSPCLVPATPPSCAPNEILFSQSSTCYSKQILKYKVHFII